MPAGASSAATIQVRLQGVAQFVAGAKAEKDALGAIGTAAQFTGLKLEAATKRGFLMNQMLFTARRYMYGFTLALTAAATSLAAVGFQFDSFKQQSTLAFTSLLGSAQLARQEIQYLFNVAAKTPFTFENITQTTRQFLAFGFSLKDTNQYLNVLGDTISAFGLSGDQISHLAIVFGQIHQSGRLLGQDMRQLQQAGIPVFPALRKELGLTQAQITQFMKGQLVIPSQYGIPAIMKYLQQRFGGMAAIQAKTFQGEVSTFHDYISQLMGSLEENVFNRATGMLGGLNNALTKLNDTLTKKGFTAFAKQLDDMLGGGGKVLAFIGTVKFTGDALITLFKDMQAPMAFAAKILGKILYVILGLAMAFNWAVKHMGPFRYLLYVVAFWLQIVFIRMVLVRTATYGLAAALLIAKKMWVPVNEVIKIYNGLMLIMEWRTKIGLRNAILMALRNSRLKAVYLLLEKGIWKMVYAYRALATAEFAALLTNPILLAVTAVLALAVIFGVLMWKVKAFRDFMLHYGWAILWFIPGMQVVALIILIIGYWKQFKEVFGTVVQFIKDHWLDLVLLLTTGGIGNILYHYWDPLVNGLEAAAKKIKQILSDALDPRNWIPFGLGSLIGGKGHVGFGWKDAVKIAFPFASPFLNATGGTISRGGVGIVGERGPEMLWMPRGTQITPMSHVGDVQYQPLQQQPNNTIHIHVPVNLHGTAIAEANASVMLDHLARQ